MEQIFQALGGLMVKAIPTVCFLILLYYYFKTMLFGPLEKVLKQRAELTEGARRDAEASLADAARKQRDYEAKFNEARAEVYRAQEETRRKWLEDQAAQVADARTQHEESVHAAKKQIAADAVSARQDLSTGAGTLADDITSVVLARKAGNAA
jgi:F-type H+-transporting ATPase subunit b